MTSDSVAGRSEDIDAHIHVTRLSKAAASVPLDVFANPVPLADQLEDLCAASDLGGVIGVEIGPTAVADTELFARCAECEAVVGVVAHLQPGEPGFSSRLSAAARDVALCGVRLRPIARYDLSDAVLMADLAQLGSFGLSLEFGAPTPSLMIAVTALARALPDVTCILTHAGHPPPQSGPERDAWSEGVKPFADLANTWCKATPIGPFDPGASSDLGDAKRVMAMLHAMFGAERIAGGTNWATNLPLAAHQERLQMLRTLDAPLHNLPLSYRHARR